MQHRIAEEIALYPANGNAQARLRLDIGDLLHHPALAHWGVDAENQPGHQQGQYGNNADRPLGDLATRAPAFRGRCRFLFAPLFGHRFFSHQNA